MNKESPEIIDFIFKRAINVHFEGADRKTAELIIHKKYGTNISSCDMYIRNISSMFKGERYKLEMSASATDYILKNFFSYNNGEFLHNSINSLKQYINHCRDPGTEGSGRDPGTAYLIIARGRIKYAVPGTRTVPGTRRNSVGTRARRNSRTGTRTGTNNVLTELRSGQKRTHWMWYIFPQIDGLGRSVTAKHYAIKSLEEARQYLYHPVLGPRLLECAEAVLAIDRRTASEIFGYPDDLKLKSSMTLFASVAPLVPWQGSGDSILNYCKRLN